MKRLCQVFILLCLASVAFGVFSKQIAFYGDDFVSFDLNTMPWFAHRPKIMTKHIINFRFMTVHPNGMLIYMGGEEEKSDFIMINLVHGKLRVTVNLGDNNPSQVGDLWIDNLSDNTWYKALVTLNGRNLRVKIDKKNHLLKLKSEHTRLDIEGLTYIAGLTTGMANNLREYKPSPSFKGCIETVSYNDRIIFPRENKNRKLLKGYTKHGSPKILASQSTCRRLKLKTLSFGYPEAYLKFASSGRINLNVQFHFRTYLANQILVSKGNELGRFSFVRVFMVKGKVFLKVRTSLGGIVQSLYSKKQLNDGYWHDLSVVVNKTLIKLAVDNEAPLVHFNPSLNQSVNEEEDLTMFIGFARKATMPSFIGCIYGLSVDGENIVFTKISPTSKSGALHNFCYLSSPCFPNRCLHHGKCIETRSGGFNCDCQSTFYRGRLCEKPIYRRTCKDYKDLGLSGDVNCIVDLDAEGPLKPITVLCNVTQQGNAVTIVGHNKIGLQRVNATKMFFPKIGYFHSVRYPSPMKEIRALINRSERCVQYVGFKCFGSKLLQSAIGPYQVTFKGIKSYIAPENWPDPSSGNNNCSCRVNGTCALPEMSCYCDIGDETWREYEGYVTDKSAMPITVVEFLESASQSYFTVGPLTCYGTSTNYASNSSENTTSELQHEAARYFKSLCFAINPTTDANVQPRSSVPQPHRIPIFTRNQAKFSIGMTASVDSTGTLASTTVKATTKIQKSKEIPVHTSTLPTVFNEEVIQTVFDDGGLAEATASSTVLQFSTEKSNSDPPLNKTQTLGGSPNGKPTTDGQNLTFSWQLVVTVILLAVVSIMLVSLVVYCVKKRGIRCTSAGFRCLKKAEKTDDHGFVEMRPGSQARKSESLDPRRSIAAGGYNVRAGIILYGTHEKF